MKRLFELFDACEWIIYDYAYDNTPLEGIKDFIEYYTQKSFLRHFIHVETYKHPFTESYEIIGRPFAVRHISKKYYKFIKDNYEEYSYIMHKKIANARMNGSL